MSDQVGDVRLKTLLNGKNNTSVTMMAENLYELVSEQGVCEYKFPLKHAMFDITAMMEDVRKQERFRVDFQQGKVWCPCCVISEVSKRTQLVYHMASIEIILGNETARPKMMANSDDKKKILKYLQGKTTIDTSEYQGLITRLKDYQCLVLIPGKLTRMKARMQSERSITEEHYQRKTEFFFCKVLASLADHVVKDNEESPIAVFQKFVIGNSGKITKSQITLSKMLWKVMFDGCENLMHADVLTDIFRVRPKRTRSVQIAGKTPALVESLVARQQSEEEHGEDHGGAKETSIVWRQEGCAWQVPHYG